MEEKMFQIYEAEGKQIQTKVQEIYSVLERIQTLEKELENFKSAFASFSKNLKES